MYNWNIITNSDQFTQAVGRSFSKNIAQYIVDVVQRSGAEKSFKSKKSGAALPNSTVWSTLKSKVKLVRLQTKVSS